MRRYAADELGRFLLALDQHLEQPCGMIVIGGAAAALAYGVGRTTHDIDTWDALAPGVEQAAVLARRESGLLVPIQHAAVADAPHDFEDRLRPLLLPGLEHLDLRTPEKHDLVLSKAVRAYEHDLAAAEAIHRLHGLEHELLLQRYLDEMTHVIGDPRRLDLNILVLVERLFGETQANEAAVRIASRRAEFQG